MFLTFLKYDWQMKIVYVLVLQWDFFNKVYSMVTSYTYCMLWNDIYSQVN